MWMDSNLYHNLNLGEEESQTPEKIASDKTVLRFNHQSSVYELQKSAANWQWYEFSWFLEEKKYRQIIYGNSVPVYKLDKKPLQDS